jgi:hypothetical protein
MNKEQLHPLSPFACGTAGEREDGKRAETTAKKDMDKIKF